MTSKTERVYPYIASVLPTAALFALGDGMKGLLVNQLANPVLTIETIVLAFVMASLAIVVSAPRDSAIASFNRNRGLSSRLTRFHADTILAGFLACVISLVVIICCRNINTYLKSAIFAAWAYLFFLSVLLLHRLFNLMLSIMDQPDASN